MSLDIYLRVVVDTGGAELGDFEVYSGNVTHNLNRMWDAAGCYEALYKSDGKTAADIAPVVEAALVEMIANPAKYKELNPPNGWGDYDGAIRFLGRLLEACKAHPIAIVTVSA